MFTENTIGGIMVTKAHKFAGAVACALALVVAGSASAAAVVPVDSGANSNHKAVSELDLAISDLDAKFASYGV